MKRAILTFMVLGLVAGASQAATETQKRAAIEKGLAYLAQSQQANGRWEYGDDYYDAAATGAALLSFLEEGHTAGSDVVINGTNYGDVVGDGLRYVFSRTGRYSISAEPAGNPDTNGNGYGVKFTPHTNYNHSRDTYDTGIVLAAVAKAAAATPNAMVTTGTEAGRTYKAVVQDVVDYFAYGQSDPGNNNRGGWRYFADYGQSDNSTSQWPVVGMLYAEAVPGVTVPRFVKNELDYWVDHIQNADGGSDYYGNKTWGSNVSRTGGWLMEAIFVNAGAGAGDNTVSSAEINAALNYLNNQWKTTANSTWNGNFNHPYAMWAAYKGLELSIGLNGAQINNLHSFTPDASQPDPLVIRDSTHDITLDWNDQWSWWEDYCEWLVDTQNASGYWGGYSYWNTELAAAWNINILNATQVPKIPVPAAALLGVLGLGSAGWRLRRRKEL